MGSQSATLTREPPKRGKQHQKKTTSALAAAPSFATQGLVAQREFRPLGGAGALASVRGIPVFAPSEGTPATPLAHPPLPLPIQRKLAIGGVNDPLEAEADRMAEHVLSAPGRSPTSLKSDAHALQRKCACQDGGGQCKEREEEEGRGKRLRRKEQNAVAPTAAPPVVDEVLRSPGQPLDPATLAFMEPRFGHDFSHVRVHTDPRAAESARSVDASAYTLGSHVVFGRGRYAPESGQGRRLLGHELTHVVQQGSLPSGMRSQPAGGHSGQLSPIVQRSPLTTEDPIHDPLIAQFRRDHGLPPNGIDPATGQRVGPSDGEIKYSEEYGHWLRSNPSPQSTTRSSQLSPMQGGVLTGDPIHDPLIARFRRGHGLPSNGIDPATGERVGPSDGEIKYGEEYERWLPQGNISSPSPQTQTPSPAPIDCSSLFESRQIAAFGGKAGPWKLNELTKTIVDTLTKCELAYVMIDVVPKPGGDDPRGKAGERAETVRQALIQWIGPRKFSEDRFQTGLSSGNEDGSEVTVYLESRGRVVSQGTGDGTSTTAPKTPKPIQGWQWVLAAGGQIAWHVSLVPGKPAATPEDVTLQFQVARNFVGHPDKESGSELQGLVQVGYNVTTKQSTVMSGAQFTEVLSLFHGLLQISGFAQVLAGVAAGGGSVSGQIQPSIGAQAVVQVGDVQIGVMIFRGLTLAPGGDSTQDTGGGVGAQFNF